MMISGRCLVLFVMLMLAACSPGAVFERSATLTPQLSQPVVVMAACENYWDMCTREGTPCPAGSVPVSGACGAGFYCCGFGTPTPTVSAATPTATPTATLTEKPTTTPTVTPTPVAQGTPTLTADEVNRRLDALDATAETLRLMIDEATARLLVLMARAEIYLATPTPIEVKP